MQSVVPTNVERDIPFEHCLNFKRIFDKNFQDEGIILQNHGARNVHEKPSPNHNNDQGKGQVMMLSTSDKNL